MVAGQHRRDGPVSVGLGRARTWKPGNSDGRSHGTVRLQDALAQATTRPRCGWAMEVEPKRLADLIRTLAGINSDGQPSLILGAVDQSPYAMAQLYQFLAADGRIQPLHAVRGVLDSRGRAIKYDSGTAAGATGDAVAARLVGTVLQYAVSSGTGRPLVRDGLGGCPPPQDRHQQRQPRQLVCRLHRRPLAVVWVGNDQNQPTGLYGATGGMRVVGHLRADAERAVAPVRDGLTGSGSPEHSTDAGCPGCAPRRLRRRLRAEPTSLRLRATAERWTSSANPIAHRRGREPAIWNAGRAIRDWFGGGDPAKQAPEPVPRTGPCRDGGTRLPLAAGVRDALSAEAALARASPVRRVPRSSGWRWRSPTPSSTATSWPRPAPAPADLRLPGAGVALGRRRSSAPAPAPCRTSSISRPAAGARDALGTG